MGYNGKTRNLLGFIKVDVKLGKELVRKARIVISRDGKRSIIGGDWLTKLQLKVVEQLIKSEYTVDLIQNLKTKPETSNELRRLEQKHPELLSRQIRIKGFNIKIQFKVEPKITQQKGRGSRYNYKKQ